MTDVDERASGKPVDESEGDEWTFRTNAAVRTLLDHVAEELAAEFVRLMRASAGVESGAGPDKEKR